MAVFIANDESLVDLRDIRLGRSSRETASLFDATKVWWLLEVRSHVMMGLLEKRENAVGVGICDSRIQ